MRLIIARPAWSCVWIRSFLWAMRVCFCCRNESAGRQPSAPVSAIAVCSNSDAGRTRWRKPAAKGLLRGVHPRADSGLFVCVLGEALGREHQHRAGQRESDRGLVDADRELASAPSRRSPVSSSAAPSATALPVQAITTGSGSVCKRQTSSNRCGSADRARRRRSSWNAPSQAHL